MPSCCGLAGPSTTAKTPSLCGATRRTSPVPGISTLSTFGPRFGQQASEAKGACDARRADVRSTRRPASGRSQALASHRMKGFGSGEDLPGGGVCHGANADSSWLICDMLLAVLIHKLELPARHSRPHWSQAAQDLRPIWSPANGSTADIGHCRHRSVGAQPDRCRPPGTRHRRQRRSPHRDARTSWVADRTPGERMLPRARALVADRRRWQADARHERPQPHGEVNAWGC